MDSFIYGTGLFVCNIFNNVGLLKLWKNLGCAYNWGPDGNFVPKNTPYDHMYEIGLIAIVAIAIFLFFLSRSSD
tara:strand:- start:123 stop:344 length:222 start_codon:yes stop_codon:yes gene_type:complete